MVIQVWRIFFARWLSRVKQTEFYYMRGKEFRLLLQIRRLHLTPFDSGCAGLVSGVRPASSAACIVAVFGYMVCVSWPCCCLGEHEQSKRVRSRRGITVRLLSNSLIGKVLRGWLSVLHSHCLSIEFLAQTYLCWCRLLVHQ